ncbi:MAG TPA: prepilin-type N-terminal cleavage/methylation domain-containing protein [Verrucomicrobiae bacterium]
MKLSQKHGKNRGAFTLIEMLVVIAIIGILAGITFPVVKGVMVKRAKAGAKAQIENLDTLINSYHAQFNSYPLDNPDLSLPKRNAVHPLYYELMGSTFNSTMSRYETVSENILENEVRNHFKQDGLRNVTHDANNPESPKSKTFLESLNSTDVESLRTIDGANIRLLKARVKDVEMNMITNASGSLFNPVRYVSTNPTNNQGRFDLWIEFEVGGNRYRASNWEKDVITLERAPQ